MASSESRSENSVKSYTGRRRIFSDAAEISDDNVAEVVSKALDSHDDNVREIKYLRDYWRGDQPILSRQKKYRKDINNKVVANIANEIVSFKVGYQFGEPIQYVSSAEGDNVSDAVRALNSELASIGKDNLDVELGEWMSVCGIGYRLIMPNQSKVRGDSLAPFIVSTIDPRNAFVVYTSGIPAKPLLCGITYRDDDNVRVTTAYAPNRYWRIEDGKVTDSGSTSVPFLPVIEYDLNGSMMGDFEAALSLLDAINTVESNRVDGQEQFIQSILKFTNCDITADDLRKLGELGALSVKSTGSAPADVDYIGSDLNQQQSQTLMDDLYRKVLEICHMPNRNGGSSTSDTGTAVVYRDGWTDAETQAKRDETYFRRSELEFVNDALFLMEVNGYPVCGIRDIDVKFTRRNYENVNTKSQVLISMLNCDRIDPRLAFVYCGMFTDVEGAYSSSQEHYDAIKAERQRNLYSISNVTERADEEI